MSKHLQRDLERIERGVLEIGALVEQSILKATSALTSHSAELAEEVIVADALIDRREVELEEDCLKVLALHQPVAVDLRYIIAVIKVNSTLERMGDQACNIAKSARNMAGSDWPQQHVDLNAMAEMVRTMVRQSLNALVKLDVDQARGVLVADDEVDEYKNAIFDTILKLIEKGVSKPVHAIRTLLVSRTFCRDTGSGLRQWSNAL